MDSCFNEDVEFNHNEGKVEVIDFYVCVYVCMKVTWV